MWPHWTIEDTITWITLNIGRGYHNSDLPSTWLKCIEQLLSKNQIAKYNGLLSTIQPKDVYSIPSVLQEKFGKADIAPTNDASVANDGKDASLMISIRQAIEMLQPESITSNADVEKDKHHTVSTEQK